MAGEIIDIINCGTIILVLLLGDDGRTFNVPFDHSPFRWLLQSEGCSAEDLIGRRANYNDENASLSFLDE